MGNCFGGGGSAIRGDGESKPPPTTTPANKNLSTWTSDWEETKWIEDTRSIWKRDLKDLPVHMDLPRLAGRLAIYSNGELVSGSSNNGGGGGGDDAGGEANSSTSKVELVYEHLRCLAQHMGQTELVDEIEARFWEFVHKDGSGDASQQVCCTDPSIEPASHRLCLLLGIDSVRLIRCNAVVAILDRGCDRSNTCQLRTSCLAPKDGVSRILQHQEQHL
jgi:hypothetical protein